ncbi:uncharacterized protein At2g29880-like isoform X2 [Ananas comosus]|uniref:Uncharacterized protein At2g29880-like isoform X2 n=1 Tax=Ananas comosus TaxID=4615 RepID=A0A6P5G5D9_ANACO|nr:uncharacterized protein At2g29880-like isoform X2 [Ananas comosus]
MAGEAPHAFPPPTESDPKKQSRAKWTDMHRAYLVELLQEHNKDKWRGQNGWNKEGWRSIHKAMITKFSHSNYTLEQVKDQEQQLKKQFKAVKNLVEMSGFGWDGDKKMVSAPSEVWEPLINNNKELRKWHNKPFPWYEALYDIYEEGKRARGCEYYSNHSRGSSSTSQPESPLATIPGVRDNFDEHVEETQEVNLSAQIPSPSDLPHPVQVPPPSQSQMQAQEEARTASSSKKRKMRSGNINKMEDYLIVKERGDDKLAKAIVTAAEVQTRSYHDDKYSVDKCMEVFYALPDPWTADEVFKATRVFQRKKKNREAWLSLKDEHRAYWIKKAWEEGI